MSGASSGNFDAFFYEAFAEEAERLLHHAAAAKLRVGHTPLTIQEAGDAAPPAPIISIRTQSTLPREWASQLRGILSRSTGYDHLARLSRFRRRRTARPSAICRSTASAPSPSRPCCSGPPCSAACPGNSPNSIPSDGTTCPAGKIHGKVMALFGVGNIGYEICRIATALGLVVRGVDPVRRHADVAYTAPEDALAQADIIVCAMNLTAHNRGYFNPHAWPRPGASPFSSISPAANSRPPPSSRRPLTQGLLSGVALDVYNEESTLAPALRTGNHAPLTADNHALLRLRKRPDVLLTPHNAFNTLEAVERKSEQSIRTLLHHRNTGQFLWLPPEE